MCLYLFERPNGFVIIIKLAIRGVSLHLMPGERLGLVGLNGAGKTSILNIITGHISRTAGNLFIAGQKQPLAAKPNPNYNTTFYLQV